jgi:hypothetical protein
MSATEAARPWALVATKDSAHPPHQKAQAAPMGTGGSAASGGRGAAALSR